MDEDQLFERLIAQCDEEIKEYSSPLADDVSDDKQVLSERKGGLGAFFNEFDEYLLLPLGAEKLSVNSQVRHRRTTTSFHSEGHQSRGL